MNIHKMSKLIEILKPYIEHVERPEEFSLNVNVMWKWLVEQICCRGGSTSIDSLAKRGEKERFHSQLSLVKMPLSHEEILKIVNRFQATRFRPSASKTITENYQRNFSSRKFKFIGLFEERLPERELTGERIQAERKVRKELRERQAFVWITRRRNEWKLSYWKNKPISDWLKDIGFAVTLMPFDSNVQKILKEFGIRLTDKNYEDVEDIFIEHVCSKLRILPVQIDKILYRNADRIVERLKS